MLCSCFHHPERTFRCPYKLEPQNISLNTISIVSVVHGEFSYIQVTSCGTKWNCEYSISIFLKLFSFKKSGSYISFKKFTPSKHCAFGVKG